MRRWDCGTIGRLANRLMDLWAYKPISSLTKRPVASLVHILTSCILILASLYLTDAVFSYTISVGHFSPYPNTSTFLLITDLSGSGPRVDINFYEDSGQLVSTASKLLPPNGKIRLSVNTYLRKAGNIIIESHSPGIIGEYWQIFENGSVIVIPLQSSAENKRLFIGGFRFPSCSSGLLIISDPHGSGPVVETEFYNQSGKLEKTESNMLRPHGVLIIEFGKLAFWNNLGKVSIKSLKGSIVIHCRYLCGNNFSLVSSMRFPDKKLMINKFSVSKKSKGKSVLVITDASGEGPAVSIQFANEQGVSKLNKLLPPNGSTIIEVSDYTGDIDKGAIQITSDSPIIANYWEQDQKRILNNPAISKFGNNLVLSYFSHSKKAKNVFSLLNFGQVSVKVEVQLYTDEGKKLGSKEIILKPYKYFEEPMEGYFGNIKIGTIIVKCPNTNVLASSSILSIESNQHLGGIYSQTIE